MLASCASIIGLTFAYGERLHHGRLAIDIGRDSLAKESDQLFRLRVYYRLGSEGLDCGD